MLYSTSQAATQVHTFIYMPAADFVVPGAYLCAFVGGRTPSDACSLCPVGTWSSGGDTNPCIPCDFGYTSPEGATCAEECYPVNAW